MPLDRGALTAIADQPVLEVLRLAQTGRLYDLGSDLGNETPRLKPHQVVGFQMQPFAPPTSFADDAAMLGNSFDVEVLNASIHQSSHIDALIHAQRHGRVYSGAAISDLRTENGWKQFGAETMPPMVLRGVVIDAASAVGTPPVPDGYAVSAAQLQAAVQAQGLTLKPGDAVLVRTGKNLQYATDRAAFEAGCPGLSGAAARWLVSQGTAVFGLDTTSADPHPVPNWDDTVHEVLLIQNGIHIIENINLEALVRDQVKEFVFICLPLRIVGGTGSWVRPLAIA